MKNPEKKRNKSATKENGSDSVLPLENGAINLEEITEGMPEQKKLQVKAFMTTRQMMTGPVPPPWVLAQYSDISPDLVERIFTMAEKEQKLSIRQFNRFDAYKTRAQWMAFLIVFAAFGLSAVLANQDHEVLAGIISGATLVSVVGAFIYGKIEEKPSN